MSRRASHREDSLDLLLDTICDTFGTVVFISMLVVIQVNESSRQAVLAAPADAAHRGLIENRRRLLESTARLQSLRRAARTAEQLRRRFADPDGKQLASDLESLVGKQDDLHDRRNADLTQLAQMQELINQTALEMRRQRDAMQAAEQAVIVARKQLEDEVALRSRTSKLPRQHKTNAKQIPFFLKEGRLSAFASVDPAGNVVRNTVESDVKVVDGKQFAEPIAGKGLLIDPARADADAITKRFRGFTKDKHFLTIVVWPDSFAHFQPVKQAVIRAGFEYQLVPLAANEKIFIGEAAVDVQDVQ